MSDEEPKLKSDTKKNKILSKQTEKAVRAGIVDSSDEEASKLFEGD